METMWKIIKTETAKTNHKFGFQSLKISNTMTDNHVIVADTFNKYFISVADSLISGVKSGNNDHENNTNPIKYLFNSFKHPFPNIPWFYTSTGKIENIIESLKTKNSCGHNEIYIKILKISAPFIISSLTYICNKSLSSGVFPNGLKFSIVKPKFKNGDKLITSYCRPISLLTSFCRVFEKLINSGLFTRICMIDILVDEEYGFRPNISTAIASYKLINKILVAMNNTVSVGCTFCDLEEACNCINHTILLDKLKFYGIVWKFLLL